VKHREIVGKIKTIAILKNIDQWFVSFSCETPEVEKKPIKTSVGIDLGIKTFGCTSDGEFIEYEHNHNLDRKIKHYQRIVFRKQKDSNQRNKVVTQLAKLCRKQKRKRKEFHAQTVNSITKNYGCVIIESLNVKRIVKNRNLAKSIHRQGWDQFVQILKNKMEQIGGTIVEVGRFFPSSKTCSSCGIINTELNLNDIHWSCNNCNSYHDRDFNAAINIHKEGLRILSPGTGNHTSGD
jgi:putative transposase